MEYSEFVEELEISLQDQMKGETAFSFRAQTMQKNGEEHKETNRKDRTENGETDEALYGSSA